MSTSDPDSRLLLVMRHGKAESNAARIDRERRLTDRGRSQAQLVGEYLRSQGVKLARVLVSDAARTRETWEHVAAQMPGLDAEVTFHEEIYAGGPSEVLELLHGSEDRHPVVMVVGHEPTVASLVARLADEESDAGSIAQARIGLPTGAMGVLSGALDDWRELREGSLTLHTIVRP
ncbi:MAG TPA: phosphohistidine phosphatase SixA [Candidatus Brachybacterium merdavium]|uniref:Phosphohistidine phosphatase SixA n=1 Tax=Candidatus Brachybacterium merdavium TaxID=2838513 RepID=A0A9D2LCF3_9MICO|nr:phosphohistidine phosphatase SixA [Candidatus Brachybacterium merdavium]